MYFLYSFNSDPVEDTRLSSLMRYIRCTGSENDISECDAAGINYGWDSRTSCLESDGNFTAAVTCSSKSYVFLFKIYFIYICLLF